MWFTMLNGTELQDYLAQSRVAKATLIFLAILLTISVFQLLNISLIPAEHSQKVETVVQVHNQAFVSTPLFGQAPTAGVLQQTRLKLTLKGTFAASTATTGSAIIGTSKGDRIYVVGDTVEGAIIEDIQPDYVVLKYQGNQEILRLPEGQRLTTSK